MDKLEKLRQRLIANIEHTIDGEDPDSRSWGNQDGILISINEAKLLVSELNQNNEK